MNENSSELLEGLRALASEGPQGAPDRLERQLRTEFRKRNTRRRAKKWVSLTSAGIAAGIALLLWLHNPAPQVAPSQPLVIAHAAAPAAEEESDGNFYPLPEAEALPPVENAMVVRVQLPVSSLQLMGVPVSEEGADAAVQAELLLGQDGLARGVRLVQ